MTDERHDDLRDLLMGWQGAELDPARQEALLARLRSDPAFRRAVAGELRLAGMVRAVQSPEPRWLGLHEELRIGMEEPVPATISLVDRMRGALSDLPAPRRSWLASHWVFAAAAMAVVATSMVFLIRFAGVPKGDPVGVLVHADGLVWSASGTQPGQKITQGPLKLRSGRATLALVNGVTLNVEGPAVLDFRSADQLVCDMGRIRARVPPCAQGFAVDGPNFHVIDIGTEFGVNLDRRGAGEVMVFDGQALVSTMDSRTGGRRTTLVRQDAAVSVDGRSGDILPVNMAATRFLAPPDLRIPSLVLEPEYARAVREARPWGYWRCELVEEGLVLNEIDGRPGLRILGERVNVARDRQGFHQLQFADVRQVDGAWQEGLWMPAAGNGYALEFWVVSKSYANATIASFLPTVPGDGGTGPSWSVEIPGRNREAAGQPGRLKFAHRWPDGQEGAVSVFSQPMFMPFRWHHVVAQRSGDRLELYLDGALVATTPLTGRERIAPGRLFFGQRSPGESDTGRDARALVGRLDEIACYDRALTADEIRDHARLGRNGGGPEA